MMEMVIKTPGSMRLCASDSGKIIADQIHAGQHESPETANRTPIGLQSPDWVINFASASLSAMSTTVWASRPPNPVAGPTWSFYIALEDFRMQEDWTKSSYIMVPLAEYMQNNTYGSKRGAHKPGIVMFQSLVDCLLMARLGSKAMGLESLDSDKQKWIVLLLTIPANLLKSSKDRACSVFFLVYGFIPLAS